MSRWLTRTPFRTALASWGPLVALVAGLVAGCNAPQTEPPPPPAEPSLVVLARPGPGSWFVGPDGSPAGFEYDLIARFASEQKLTLRTVTDDSAVSLIAAVAGNDAQVGVGGLFRPSRPKESDQPGESNVLWTRGIVDDEPVVIFNADGFKPRDWHDLVGTDVAYMAGTGISESLAAVRAEHPEIHWHAVDVPTADALIAQVDDARVDYAVVMASDAALARNVFVGFDVAFGTGVRRELAWALPAGQVALREKLDAYLERERKSGAITALRDRYFAPVRGLGRPDAGALHDRVAAVLPRYRRYFQEAQDATGLDWRLVAAIAYQESQWDPDATSETGVRGMMQFTTDTAKDLGLADRLDPGTSIVAAARYVRDLKDKLPARIAEPDRTWFALAAFNIGLGHLEDARVLAQRMKLNPDSWSAVRKALPLLADPEYYNGARLGYARGGMPVAFVDRVRAYYDILARTLPPHTPRLRAVADAAVPQ
ncbi:MAG: membrane-bound lytic murein transglycosylase MltF [Proteobacteria bacterium]|nr:membrane-bound lytic murein transglycosylase MltF [Pseudomonadota bacterium]